jgi:hypothetical protein
MSYFLFIEFDEKQTKNFYKYYITSSHIAKIKQ